MNKKYSGMAIASLVLGITGIVFDFIFIGIILGIVGVILGIIALGKDSKKGMALAGTILSGLSVVWFVVYIALIVNSPSFNTVSKTEEDTVAVEEETEDSTIYITEIKAIYEGSTEAGEIINSDNADLKVIATYEDGKKRELDNWTLSPESVTLEASQTYDFVVTYKDVACNLSITCSTVSPEVYKASCFSIAYEELSRNPTQYEGDQVVFQGEIIQVMEGSGYAEFRINVTKSGEYITYWDDTVYVDFEYVDGASRFLEDDIVTFYGNYNGLYSYETVLGATVTIPSVTAEYIELN